jgi:hypothetical protein
MNNEKKTNFKKLFLKKFQLHMYVHATNIHYIQPVPELPPHRKQACADSKRDSKITKIIFSVTHITEL